MFTLSGVTRCADCCYVTFLCIAHLMALMKYLPPQLLLQIFGGEKQKHGGFKEGEAAVSCGPFWSSCLLACVTVVSQSVPGRVVAT